MFFSYNITEEYATNRIVSDKATIGQAAQFAQNIGEQRGRMGTGAARWRLGLVGPGRFHAGEHSCAWHRQIVWRALRRIPRGFRCFARGGCLDSGALLFLVQLVGSSVEYSVGEIFVPDCYADWRDVCGSWHDGFVFCIVRHVFVY